MLDNLMIALAVATVLFGLGYVVSIILKEAKKHKLYVTPGVIKFACPRSFELLYVATRSHGIIALPCPCCGKMVKIPDKKNCWVSVEELR